jgi:hypothetical protein
MCPKRGYRVAISWMCPWIMAMRFVFVRLGSCTVQQAEQLTATSRVTTRASYGAMDELDMRRATSVLAALILLCWYITVFWDTVPCGLVQAEVRFGMLLKYTCICPLSHDVTSYWPQWEHRVSRQNVFSVSRLSSSFLITVFIFKINLFVFSSLEILFRVLIPSPSVSCSCSWSIIHS